MRERTYFFWASSIASMKDYDLHFPRRVISSYFWRKIFRVRHWNRQIESMFISFTCFNVIIHNNISNFVYITASLFCFGNLLMTKALCSEFRWSCLLKWRTFCCWYSESSFFPHHHRLNLCQCENVRLPCRKSVNLTLHIDTANARTALSNEHRTLR